MGVAARESDPGVVIRAADARLNLLRAIAPGPFELARASLVKRVEEAREKVLAEIAAGPVRAAVPTVDGFAMPPPPGQLAATMATAAPPTLPVAPPAPISSAGTALPPPVPGQGGWGGGEPGAAGDGFGSIRIRTTVYRKKTPVAGIALALLALAAVAGGLAYYTLVVKGQRQLAWRGPEKEKPARPSPVQPVQEEEERKTAAADRTPEDRLAERQAREERERQEREAQQGQKSDDKKNERRKQKQERAPGPLDEPKQDEPKQDESGVEQAEQLEETLAAVFAAMRSPDGESDSAGIVELLKSVSRQARGAAARKRVAGWQALETYRKGFLEYRTQALAAIKQGDEYDVEDRRIAVVEVDDEVFKYLEDGKTNTLPRAKLPAGLVLAIVTSWFDARPANDLYLGAYHFTKQEPNAGLAREHWEKAQAGGADASSLLPLLDDPVFTRATAGE
ncbi:MAG: hypothetical protein ACKOHG_03385 [Planctomycetia bacterium]